MFLYLLKSSACLAVFMLFYKLFLERESVHQFKRFYLLVAIAGSFCIPFITFTTVIEQTLVQPILNEIVTPVVLSEAPIETSINWWPIMALSIYTLGVLFFGLKFILNLYRLLQKISLNDKVQSQKSIIVLLKEHVIPHTFLKYMFFEKEAYNTNRIPKEILLHEEVHVAQKHSLDIIFIELLQVVFWFHPLIYFIKKDIKLNHEFLADQAVIKQGYSAKAYQSLLLEYASQPTNSLISSINYASIKKRLTIMKTHTSKTAIWLRSLILLPLVAVLVYGFSEKKEVVKETSLEKEITIPTLKVAHSPLSMELNGKSTSLESLKKDFLSLTNGEKSDLKIVSNEALKMSFVNTLNELLEPYVTKIFFESKLAIIDDRPKPASSETEASIPQENKPMLLMAGKVKMSCETCAMDKKMIEKITVITSTGEQVEQFKIKFPGKPTQQNSGNTLDKVAQSYLEEALTGDGIVIFDIRTKEETIKSSITIKIGEVSPLSIPKPLPKNASPEEIAKHEKAMEEYETWYNKKVHAAKNTKTGEEINFIVNDEIKESPNKPQESKTALLNGQKVQTTVMSIEEIKNIKLSVEEGKLTSFKIKLPGKKTESITGSELNETFKGYLDTAENGVAILIFDIKSSTKDKYKPIQIVIEGSKTNSKETKLPPPPPPPAPATDFKTQLTITVESATNIKLEDKENNIEKTVTIENLEATLTNLYSSQLKSNKKVDTLIASDNKDSRETIKKVGGILNRLKIFSPPPPPPPPAPSKN